MNIIFIDFEGTLETLHLDSDEDIEKRIAILGTICKKYNCKVVIEAAAKVLIDENTLETENENIKKIFNLFNKYGIECVGRTPCVPKWLSNNSYYSMWKDFEIRKYLFEHPEIEHYCVIDDGDFTGKVTDLKQVEDHLILTKNYSRNYEEEGLLESHIEEVGKILKKENNIRKLVLKYKK